MLCGISENFLDKQSETCQKKLPLQEIHSSLDFCENHKNRVFYAVYLPIRVESMLTFASFRNRVICARTGCSARSQKKNFMCITEVWSIHGNFCKFPYWSDLCKDKMLGEFAEKICWQAIWDLSRKIRLQDIHSSLDSGENHRISSHMLYFLAIWVSLVDFLRFLHLSGWCKDKVLCGISDNFS